MRRPNARIDVTVTLDSAYALQDQALPHPVEFRYLRQRIKVAKVLDQWIEAGRWWEQEPEAVAWRVVDLRGGVYELEMTRTEPPMWRVRCVYD